MSISYIQLNNQCFNVQLLLVATKPARVNQLNSINMEIISLKSVNTVLLSVPTGADVHHLKCHKRSFIVRLVQKSKLLVLHARK